MKLEDAMKRIEALEREIVALKAQRSTDVHHHYHYPPQPLMQPRYGDHQPWHIGEAWCGNSLDSAVGLAWANPAPDAAPPSMPNPHGTFTVGVRA